MAVATDALGVPGYSFADLHEPERLSSLYERFCEEVQASDPALWREWGAYRQAPRAPRPPIALSNLLIAMATRAQDDLFRFKVDFVRRRALPLLKGGAHIVSTPEDEAIVEALIAGASSNDRELAIARAGCVLMDLEKSPVSSVASHQSSAASHQSSAAGLQTQIE